MSEALTLLTRDDSKLSVAFTPDAQEMKDGALAISGLVARVSNADENAQAVAAQTALKRVLKLVEDSRKAVKEPVLDYGRKIDGAAKDFITELKVEEIRLARLVGDFQQLELAKARAAEAARLKDLAEIERRKQEELSKANSHEELDEIHARANEEAAAVKPVQIARATGQVVKDEWEFQVTNEWALAMQYPNCVTLLPKRTEIKQLLESGIVPNGVTAKKVVKSGVRLTKEPEAIAA